MKCRITEETLRPLQEQLREVEQNIAEEVIYTYTYTFFYIKNN